MNESVDLTPEEILLLTELYRIGGCIGLQEVCRLKVSVKNLILDNYITEMVDECVFCLTSRGLLRYKEFTNLEKLCSLEVLLKNSPVVRSRDAIINYIVNQLTEEELPAALVSNIKLIRDLAKTRMYFLSILPIRFSKEVKLC